MTFPEDLLVQGCMLATATKNPAELVPTLRGVADIKWDGVRCLAYADEGEIMLRNRNGVEITHRYPEIVEHLATVLPHGSWVFDGEMLAFNDDGVPEFKLISRRDAQSKPMSIRALARQIPATYMAFDFLWFNGTDLRKAPTIARLELLQQQAESWPEDPRLRVTTWSQDVSLMWDLVNQHGLEGLIVKQTTSRYIGKRHDSWLKLKPTLSISAVVTGYELGKGNREGKIGALLVALVGEDGALVPSGKVGTGFTQQELSRIKPLIDRGDELLIEIEFQELTPDRQLRFPSYRGVRSDLRRSDCHTGQLA